MIVRAAVLFAVIISASPVSAEIVRCVSPDGGSVFTNMSCPKGYTPEKTELPFLTQEFSTSGLKEPRICRNASRLSLAEVYPALEEAELAFAEVAESENSKLKEYWSKCVVRLKVRKSVLEFDAVPKSEAAASSGDERESFLDDHVVEKIGVTFYIIVVAVVLFLFIATLLALLWIWAAYDLSGRLRPPKESREEKEYDFQDEVPPSDDRVFLGSHALPARQPSERRSDATADIAEIYHQVQAFLDEHERAYQKIWRRITVNEGREKDSLSRRERIILAPVFVVTGLYERMVRKKFNRLFPRKTEHDRGRHDDAVRALYECASGEKESYRFLSAIPEYREHLDAGR